MTSKIEKDKMRDSLCTVFALTRDHRGCTSGLGLLSMLLVMLLPLPMLASTASSTATTLTASSSQVTPGEAVTLTAGVLSGRSVTVGQVLFCNAAGVSCADSNLLGMAQLTAAGTATFTLIPGIGVHDYKAIFAGTHVSAASTSSEISVTVAGTNATKTTLSVSGNVGDYTLTAKVVGAVGGMPTGSISFLDVSNGTYSLATEQLGPGTTGVNLSNSYNSSGDDVYGIGVGDLNGDGKPDLVMPNLHQNTVTILLGNGDGTFTTGATFGVGGNPMGVSVGDFNADGKADLAVSGLGTNNVTILLGNGDGTFSGGVPYSTGALPQNMTLADFNGDGNADIAIPNYGSNTLTILLGNGDGTFTAAPDVQAGNGPSNAAVADFNGDGNADLAITDYNDNTMTVLLGNGDGTFRSAPGAPRPGGGPNCAITADFNGDGKPDLAIANYNGNTISVALGNGDGTFSSPTSIAVGGGPNWLAAGDFNGDGKQDLAVVNQNDNSLMMLLGKGDGTFTPAVTVSTGYYPFMILAADFNGDGIMDLVTGNDDNGRANVYLTQLSETASVVAGNISPYGAGTHLAEAVYAGDNTYAASNSATVGLLAEPLATTITLGVIPTSISYGQQVLLTATLSPYTAQDHSTNGDAVTFYSGGTAEGTGVLSSGYATLNLTSLPAGADSLTASFAGDANFGASVSAVVPLMVSTVPTLSFTVPGHTFGDMPFTVAASSNSAGVIGYSVVSGPATITGATVSLTGTGTVVLEANQAASGTYGGQTQNATFVVASATPILSFASIPVQTFGNAAFAVSASSASSGAVTYAVSSGPATASGATVSITGAGTVTLSASQVASTNYSAASATVIFTVNPGPTTLAFASIPAQTFGNAAFAVSATSASSGAVAYAVSSGPATVSGATVVLTGAGTVVLTASQASSGNYTAATATITFIVTPATSALSFASIPTQTYGNAAFAVSATSASSGAVTYAVSSGPATVSGATVNITGAGTVNLTANQVASSNYTAATAATSFIVNPASSTLHFASIPVQTYGNAAFAVSATSASIGVVTYAVSSGPATVSGATVSTTGAGTVNLTASQVASNNYIAGAAAVSFIVNPATTTLAFAPIAPEIYGNAAFAVSATSTSSGAVTYSVSSGPATVSGAVVSVNGVGTVTLIATQGASGNYASSEATTSFVVNPAAPVLSFATVPPQAYGNSPFAVSATSVSSGAVTYTVSSGPASLSGAMVSITGAGTVKLVAYQAANGDYAATTATTSFTVSPATPTLSFVVIPPQAYGNPAFVVRAASPSSGAMTYSVTSGPATVSGAMVSITGAGNVTITASQSASEDYAAATATTSFIVSVAVCRASITSSSTSLLVGNPAVLVATVVSPAGGPNGTAFFLDGGIPMGTAILAGGSATLTSSFQTLGDHLITATYGGGQDFGPASSSSLDVTVIDFVLKNAGNGNGGIPPQPLNPGGAQTYALTIVPTAGSSLPAPITLSLSGMPAGATAVIASPLWIPLTSTSWRFPARTAIADISMTVQLPSRTSRLDQPVVSHHKFPSAAWAILLLPLLFKLRRAGKQLGRLTSAALLMSIGMAVMAGVSGCGADTYVVPPPISYPMTVTAVSGALTRSVEMSITVQ
jgi:hypothetical protein